MSILYRPGVSVWKFSSSNNMCLPKWMLGKINGSAKPWSSSLGCTVTDILWRQDGEADVMQLQTLWGIRRNITHCFKKRTKKNHLSNPFSSRQFFRRTNSGEKKRNPERLKVTRKRCTRRDKAEKKRERRVVLFLSLKMERIPRTHITSFGWETFQPEHTITTEEMVLSRRERLETLAMSAALTRIVCCARPLCAHTAIWDTRS